MTLQSVVKPHDSAKGEGRPSALLLVSSQLAQLSLLVEQLSGAQKTAVSDHSRLEDCDALQLARILYKSRRRRTTYFKAELFSDPAYDILLDLFISHHERRKISVTSACIASCVPATTALRWISILVAEGLIDRAEDQCDRRRAYVQISESGLEAMNGFLSDIAGHIAF